MKKLSAKFHNFRESLRNLGENPDFDWHFSLVSFAILLVLVCLINFFFYVRLGEESVVDTTARSAPIEILNREELDSVIENLKANDLDATVIPSGVFDDPSM